MLRRGRRPICSTLQLIRELEQIWYVGLRSIVTVYFRNKYQRFFSIDYSFLCFLVLRSSFPIITIFKPIISGVSCEGNENRISECNHHSDFFCPGSGGVSVAAVVCVEEQADLVPDLYAIMSTTYLEDKHLFFLQVFYKLQNKTYSQR